jgi:hypothetical protein
MKTRDGGGGEIIGKKRVEFTNNSTGSMFGIWLNINGKV